MPQLKLPVSVLPRCGMLGIRTVEPIPLPSFPCQCQKRRPLLSVHNAIFHVQKDGQRERLGARRSIQFVVGRRGRVWGKEGEVDTATTTRLRTLVIFRRLSQHSGQVGAWYPKDTLNGEI